MTKTTGTCKDVQNLMDVSGLCNPGNASEVIRKFPYWKQLYISESLQIPEVKPDIEQINSISVTVKMLRKKVIKTPRSYDDSMIPARPTPNLEGKLLTGRKLIVEGELWQVLEYTANVAAQSVHSVEFFVPFSAYIVVPLAVSLTNAAGAITVDSYDVDFTVNACVENVTACVMDVRTILKQVTLMLSAVPASKIC